MRSVSPYMLGLKDVVGAEGVRLLYELNNQVPFHNLAWTKGCGVVSRMDGVSSDLRATYRRALVTALQSVGTCLTYKKILSFWETYEPNGLTWARVLETQARLSGLPLLVLSLVIHLPRVSCKDWLACRVNPMDVGVPIPPPLLAVITPHLNGRTTGYLLEKDGRPLHLNGMTRVLNGIFGQPVGALALRDIYLRDMFGIRKRRFKIQPLPSGTHREDLPPLPLSHECPAPSSSGGQSGVPSPSGGQRHF